VLKEDASCPTKLLIPDISSDSNFVKDKQKTKEDKVMVGRTEKVLRLINLIKSTLHL
jgi:hypothetical protein